MLWYFIRHGETDWNLNGRFQGQTDIPLNETGRDQAEQAAVRLKNAGIVFTDVYSSPLKRAVETASIISGADRDAIHIDERLIEMCFGEYEGSDFRSPQIQSIFDHPSRNIPEHGMESYKHLLDRADSFIRELKETKGTGEGSILIQSHGACIRALLTCLRGTELDEFWDIKVKNCEAFSFQPLPSGAIVERGKV